MKSAPCAPNDLKVPRFRLNSSGSPSSRISSRQWILRQQPCYAFSSFIWLLEPVSSAYKVSSKRKIPSCSSLRGAHPATLAFISLSARQPIMYFKVLALALGTCTLTIGRAAPSSQMPIITCEVSFGSEVGILYFICSFCLMHGQIPSVSTPSTPSTELNRAGLLSITRRSQECFQVPNNELIPGLRSAQTIENSLLIMVQVSLDASARRRLAWYSGRIQPSCCQRSSDTAHDILS
jgi:hypothetical protein